MIKTIVVPVDGSEHARRAATLAAEIAGKLGAAVVLVTVALPAGRVPEGLRRMAEAEHLIDPERSQPAAHGNVPGETLAALHSNREIALDQAAAVRVAQWLLDEAEQIVKDQGVSGARKRLESGDPAEAILGVAREESADLIVMGSRGLSALGGLLMGSVSNKLCQLAECSCLTVK